MFIVLGGFIVLGVLSAGLVFGVLSVVLKRENVTDSLLFWILSCLLTVILSGIFVSVITRVTDITFIDK